MLAGEVVYLHYYWRKKVLKLSLFVSQVILKIIKTSETTNLHLVECTYCESL